MTTLYIKVDKSVNPSIVEYSTDNQNWQANTISVKPGDTVEFLDKDGSASDSVALGDNPFGVDPGTYTATPGNPLIFTVQHNKKGNYGFSDTPSGLPDPDGTIEVGDDD